jgi:GNAT superfamily N-acetyltransferase
MQKLTPDPSQKPVEKLQPKIIFEIATAQDADALVDMVNKAYRGETGRQGWTSEAHFIGGQRLDRDWALELIAHPETRILLARPSERASEFMSEDKGKLLGCVQMERKQAADQTYFGYLGMLTVAHDAQTSGLGSLIFDAAEKYLRDEWKLARLEGHVIDRRPELIAWYERRGCKLTGETKPFPYGQDRFGRPMVEGLQFLVLEKHLI